MNKVFLMGRLTKDAEVRASTDGTQIARFTFAVDRRFAKGDAKTDFITCVAFNKRAEFLERFGRKGMKFVIEGRIQTGSYQNKDGQNVYTTDVVVEEIEFAESKASNQNESNPAPATNNDGFMNIPEGLEEDLPFV